MFGWYVFVLCVVVGVECRCFCSATGDPHIREFSGSTSSVGAGYFPLLHIPGRYSLNITVAQTGPKLTQITDLQLALAGDNVEDIPGYGQIHRARGLEVRVLQNNNVFIIWDSNIVSGPNTGFCGKYCPPDQHNQQAAGQYFAIIFSVCSV